uniref:LysM domain-containing protein n=1 Tax=Mantoniella antarctica TaxID=81844 RepID=A0A7S0SH90_9CHLO|mmetsp:Transcript_23302/g.57729  ORF Transcript_23302/g.57729 Transcript_23302/m.57729 type:complete len:258 (+) Transcript_23302:233-1006(+)
MDLPDDVLRKLLGYLPTGSLLTTASAVCSRWRRIIHHPSKPLWRDSFAQTFGLSSVSGAPKALTQWCARATVGTFVVAHPLERGDTVASIAVRHSMSLGEVKRANGLLSEHALNLRTSYLVPVRDASKLAGANAHIHLDSASNREVAQMLSNDAFQGRGDEPTRRAPAPADPVRAANLSVVMAESLAKSIGQDVETARFYIQQAGGDIRRAHRAFMSDKEWDPAPETVSRTGNGGGGVVSAGIGVRQARLSYGPPIR